jgi:hypothetical protein
MTGPPHYAILGEFAVHGVGADREVVAGEPDFLGGTVLQELDRVCNRQLHFASYRRFSASA